MKRVLALVVFAIGFVISGHLATTQTLQFSVHLQDYGWQPDRLKVTNGEREIAETRHIGFDSAGKLYVGFAIEGKSKLLKSGDANNIFRVLTLDSETGAVKRKLDFPTQSKEWVGLNVAANDALLVTANNKMQLVGEDGLAKATFDIPMPSGNHILFIRESASEKTLLITILDINAFYFLRADSLSPITHCYVPPERPRENPETFSDDTQLSVVGTTTLGPPYELVKGSLCGDAEDLWPLGANTIEPLLLDGSAVLGVGPSNSDSEKTLFEVRKKNGELAWREELPKHIAADLSPIRTTRDWGRIAVEVVEQTGGNERFDISPKTISMGVWVYDARTGKQVGSIKYPKLGRYEFALNPNGDRIAVLSTDGGTLQVWKLTDN